MNISKLFQKTEEKEFTKFPRTLETYAWYKLILIIAIAFIVTTVVTFALMSIVGIDPRKDNIIQLIYTAISMIATIPAVYIANKLLYKIPFSTQVAPIRKWDWSIYIKAFIITLLVYAIFQGFQIFAIGGSISFNVPIVILLLCIILPIFQGFAEEFAFRGLFMQTLGSWFGIPAVAIFLQAALFAVAHRYVLFALISVLCTGLLYGFIVWYGQGLEVSSAMHAVNNIFSFLAIALGLQGRATGISEISLLGNLFLLIVPIIIVLLLDKKFNLFGVDSGGILNFPISIFLINQIND